MAKNVVMPALEMAQETGTIVSWLKNEGDQVSKGEALLEIEEHIRLGKMFAEHNQEHSGPDYLVVPFLLYNLSAEDRAIMSQEMPPVVTQQLVPVAWKEKWAPMSPFLLS